MPHHKTLNWKNSELVIWKYDENESFDDLVLSENDLAKTANYPPKKKAEFLMVRRILNEKLPGEKIIYDDNGQPFLENSDLKISISHSFPLAGIAFSDENIGIDIEKIKDKIKNVQHKFLHDSELLPEKNTEELTAIWSIKEAVYKLHPSKLWSLKKHYATGSFQISDEFETVCKVFDDGWEDSFNLKIFKIDDYFVSIAEQENELNFKIF